ncbi:hypothetical protein M569_00907, partial [Genlisea aurea]
VHSFLYTFLVMASSILRFRKLCFLEPAKSEQKGGRKKRKSHGSDDDDDSLVEENKPNKKPQNRIIKCIDSCCWLIGFICSTWWLLLFLYYSFPSNLLGLQSPELPGTRLRREGLTALHPVILVPGTVTGGLELWEGRACSDGLFRHRLWGGSFTEIFKRPMCWLEHLSLDNETGFDPPGIRVRAVPGLVAADYFAPGYFVWAILIENLARLGYEGKNMYMAAYDWRLAFQNTEVRDQTLSRLKSKIEQMYATNGENKVVVVPHSMGVNYFLHFMKWVEAPMPMGGGGGRRWCRKYLKAVVNIAPAFLGVPKSVASVLSAESKDVAFVRSMAPGLLGSGLQTLEHVMRVTRTWDSVVSLLPKGGEALWGDLHSSPEDHHVCNLRKPSSSDNQRGGGGYGRIVSFHETSSLDALPTLQSWNGSCRKVWTEYDEVSPETIRRISEDKAAYTVESLLDLLRWVAPKMMKRAEAHFSHGLADDLNDPKYDHYKYWSNPLETKLPHAPEMEIYCSYGVGIPTERSYVYKRSQPSGCRSIPFQIDSSADGGPNDGCLKGGVYFVDGDETVSVLSAGFMCAKGWRGKTKFNPSGIATYVREYKHKAPANLLEGRGTESGGHVDIMGNVGLIEEILRVAAGANGEEIGGDRIYSEIMNISDKVKIRL